MTHPCKWALVMTLGLAACERSNLTHAQIDASALRAAPHQLLDPNTLVLTVDAAGMSTQHVLLDPNSLQAALDVASGPNRLFRLVAHAGDDPTQVSYFGRVRVDMPSGAKVNVVLPAFPAGEVQGTAATLEGVNLPDHTLVHLHATAPSLDAPVDFDAEVRAGAFSQPLPAGPYEATCSVQLGGQTYVTRQSLRVRAGSVAQVSIVLRNINAPHLGFSVQPSASVVAGTALSVEISLLDKNDKLAPTSPATPVIFTAIDIDSDAAIPLQGTTQGTTAQGKLTVSTLLVTLAGGPYALEVSAVGLQTMRSTPFTVAPGMLQGVGVVAPAQVVAGVPFAAQVGGVDAFGNIAPAFVGSVQLSSSDPNGSVPPQVNVAASDAGAHSVSLTLNTAGAQMLSTRAANLSGSTPISVLPAPAASLAFAPWAANALACTPLGPPVQVRLYDALGNLASNSAAQVTLGVLANPAHSQLQGSLTASATAGVASFADATLSAAGSNYLLQASSVGLLSATSSPFDVSAALPSLSTAAPLPLLAHGALPVQSTAAQACRAPIDVLMTFDTGGAEQPASGGPLLGRNGLFTLAWDTVRDLGANANTLATLHLRGRSQGVTGAAVDLPVIVQNSVNPQTLAAPASLAPTAAPLVAMAVADMDGNGLADIVGVTGNGNSLQVILQATPGVYSALAEIPLGSAATRISLGDINRDGAPDAAVALPQARSVQVLINNGSGILLPNGAAAAFPVGAYDLALADLNKDGRLDLAVTTNNPNFTYSANANFTTPLSTPTAAVCSRGLALADMNRDGRTDAVVADCNNRLLVGNNTGTSFAFSAYATDANSERVAVGDLNRDGFLDVLASHPHAAHLTRYAGIAGGALGARQTFALPAPAVDVALADLNGDGNLDALALLQDGALVALGGDGALNLALPTSLAPSGVQAMALDGGRAAAVNLATASGVGAAVNQQAPGGLPPHAPRAILLPEPVQDVATGDLDGDGYNDALACLSSGVQTLLGQGNGLLRLGPAIADSAQSVALLDLNNDLILDAALAEASGSAISTALGVGDGSFGIPVPGSVSSPALKMLPGDLDEDANADLLVLTANGADLFFGDGTGTLSGPVSLDLGGNLAVNDGLLADVTGDGHLDVVVSNSNASDGNLRLAAGNGDGSFMPPLSIASSPNPMQVQAADVNHDGVADLLVLSSTGNFSVLLGRGAGLFADPNTHSVGAQQLGVAMAVGQYNANPALDLFFATPSNSLIARSGDGLGGFNSSTLLNSLNAPSGLRSADLDGDGFTDVLAFSSNSNAIMAHMSNRNGFFASQDVALLGNQPHHPQLLDLNRDGKLDVLVPCTLSNLVTLVQGNGAAALGSPSSTALNTPGLIASADFNHDGITDVVTMPSDGNTLQFAPGNGTGGLGSPTNSFTVRPVRSLAAVDFNRDGYPDVVATTRAANSVTLMTNQSGSGSFLQSFQPLVDAPREVAVGDLNHDGAADVVLTLDTAALWLASGDGNSLLTPLPAISLPAPAQNVAVADLNHDGRDDIVVTLPTLNAVAYFRNQGGGLFTSTAVHTVTASPTHLSVGDVSGDGIPDVVVSTSAYVIHVLTGDAAVGVQDDWLLGTGGDITGTALGDINGDGRNDIVVTSNSADAIEVILSGYP